MTMKIQLKTLWLRALLASSLTTGGPMFTRPALSAPASNTNEVRLNFRSASLDSVLSYMSAAAGFTINLQTPVSGKITLWSDQPVSRDEAFTLLSSALDHNGYTALRQGHILTIYSKDEAKKRDLPVKNGSNPRDIPKSAEMVTQILPVHYVSAIQLARDLQPLVPEKATVTANEGGNALIVTDTQASIHRLAEIIQALDTAVTAVSRVRVYPLKFAEAKAVASVIKDLFQPADTGGNNGQNTDQTFQNAGSGAGPFQGGPGGPGGFPDSAASFGAAPGANDRGANRSSGGRSAAPRVVAVAEERSNSLVVSAAEDKLPVIEHLIAQIDINVQGMTELHVFRLHNADAQDTADLLTSLFPSNSSTGQGADRPTMQFAAPTGNAGGNSGATTSSRQQKQASVAAVADLRTGSVVVTAGHDLMVQITGIINELDADSARKQQVFVFSVQNSNAQSIQGILQSLFPNMSGNGMAAQTQTAGQQNGVGNQLENRATQENQNLNQGQRGGTGLGGGLGSGGLGR
jgi:general secretion pathway protein D